MKELDNEEIYDISRTTISNNTAGAGVGVGGYLLSRAKGGG